MGTLYISEYESAPMIAPGVFLPMGLEPAIAVQSLPIDIEPAHSQEFSAKTRFVRLHATEPCKVDFNAGLFVGMEGTEFFGVQPRGYVAVMADQE